MDTDIKIAKLEKQLSDSMMIVSGQLQQVNIFLNQIAQGVASQDIILGAIRNILVSKGLLNDKEIEEKAEELVALIKLKEEAKKSGLGGEVLKMGQGFKESETSAHPPEAFIFGN